ncbi:MAG: response regulator [gamma proteobacterium symbiont of Lucinoma myriamae]|nr:response regulator [gamma proteobacterium symbiont of Lucinoma myriamae]MCU7820067.1 response regulator [gamma proteobacterium symbiont of Lucinoma myriamae]MCU7831485.1 response regulator [gamma proteobacterium symbiont of Lucinoma myriamae]
MDKYVINTVLLTDSSTIDGLIISLLDDQRFNVASIHSSEPYFFKKLIDYKPQLIFIRAMLSNLDGLSVCDRIRSHPALRKARLVFISTDTLNRESAINHRANDFLKVPFSRQDLSKIVDPLLEKKIRLLFS